MLERRNFLKGMLVAIGGTEAVIRLASPSEVKALTVNQPTLVSQTPEEAIGQMFADNGTVYMKNRKGKYMPVGWCTEISMGSVSVDATSHYDGTVRMMPGFVKDPMMFFRGPV